MDAEEALAVVAEATAAAVDVLAVEVLQAHGNNIRNNPNYYSAKIEEYVEPSLKRWFKHFVIYQQVANISPNKINKLLLRLYSKQSMGMLAKYRLS